MATKKTKPVEQEVTTEESTSSPSTFTKLRTNHRFRLALILILITIVGILFFVWKQARIALVVIFITLLAAFGLEANKSDYDMGKLIKTKSFQESKVSRDEKGNILFDKLGNITTDKVVGKKVDDYNCDDFSTQPEAQVFFEKVGGLGNDINRLDANKDGEACESLPQGKK